MRYTTATAFRQALDQRLKNQSTTTGLPLVRLRKRVAFELFLRRLAIAAPERWVLKGALALDFRLGAGTRFTKDIDLGRDDDERVAIEDITAAQQLELDDFFAFSATRSADLDATDEFSAIRFHVRAQLAGRTFEQFIVDIGFADSIDWVPDTIETPGSLSFADIEPIQIPAVPIPQHLAEKVHAYTRRYGEDERPSTRPKDLVDMLLIAGSEEAIDAGELRQALERTFEGRGRQPLPLRLPAPPPAWAGRYEPLAEEAGVERGLDRALHLAAAFLDPALSGEAIGSWDPQTARWVAGGQLTRVSAPPDAR